MRFAGCLEARSSADKTSHYFAWSAPQSCTILRQPEAIIADAKDAHPLAMPSAPASASRGMRRRVYTLERADTVPFKESKRVRE